jgi:hypothetical protein
LHKRGEQVLQSLIEGWVLVKRYLKGKGYGHHSAYHTRGAGMKESKKKEIRDVVREVLK